MIIITSDGKYELSQPETAPIFINVQIGDRGTFSKPIPFLFDTGAYGDATIFVPGSLLKALKIDLLVVADAQSELGDGSTTKNEYSALVDIRFVCIPSGRSILFKDVPVIVNNESTSDPLINLTLFCDTLIRQGKLMLLEFNPSSIGTS